MNRGDNEKIKVLLVDDDELLGGRFVDELNQRGYEAYFMNSVHGLTEAIRTNQPDVLIFDVEIGKENGIEMAQNLYDGNPTLPIIFISSHHSDEMKEKGLQAGAVAYLDKPFSVKLLAAHIDRFTRTLGKSPSITHNEQLQKVGNIQLDLRNRAIITKDNNIVELRPMEFNLLRKLMANFNQAVKREDMLYAAWEGQEQYYNNQSLNNYVRRLRNLLEDNSNLKVMVHRGLGYSLVVE